jgi:uncharacterized protein (DUF1330 family)
VLQRFAPVGLASEAALQGCWIAAEPVVRRNPMPAYIISEVSEVVDPAVLEKYRALAEVTIKQYGGRYLVRGGEWESLEGEWALERTIVVEFPSWERAKAWYRSPEYAAALELSRVALKRKMLMVDGVA